MKGNAPHVVAALIMAGVAGFAVVVLFHLPGSITEDLQPSTSVHTGSVNN